MTAVDSDIDNFIRQEKAKLANERQNLNLLESPDYYRGNARRKWGPPVDLDSFKTAEKENYKRTWYELKGKYVEPSSSRKQKETTMKLSPRGVLDTDALILNVQKEKEREEYEDRWRRYHGGQESSSRGPINQASINRVGGGTSEPSDLKTGPGFISPRTQRQKDREEYKQLWQQQHPEGSGYQPAQNIEMNKEALDIDQIIREVQKEKMEEEERLGTHNALFGQPTVAAHGRRTTTRGVEEEKKFDTEGNRKLQEHQHVKNRVVSDRLKQDGSLFDDSQRNIENKIAEAKQEADDYRKRWEAQNSKGNILDKRQRGDINGKVLPLGGYEEHRKILNEERKKEYNEMLRQQLEQEKSRTQNYGVLIDEDDRLEKMRQLREERKREYNEYLAKQRQIPTRERYNLPPEFDESEEFGLFHNLGMEDKKRQQKREPLSQLNLPGQNFRAEIKRRGYQGQPLREHQGQPLREQTDEYKVSTLGANDSDAVKLQKIKARNDEYNQFLITKSEKDKNRFTEKKPSEDTGIFATIPGLRYSTSAQRKELAAERNREYNEMMHQKSQNRTRRDIDVPFAGPKQGWSTPTYEEVLDQKRAQESNYRRANDTAYETSLHAQETERRIRELQKDLTNNPIAFEPGASELVREQKEVLSRLKDIDNDLKDDIKIDTVMSKPSDVPVKNYQDTAFRGPPLELGYKGRYGANQSDGQLFGTRDVDPRSEKLKKQEEYKRDLQQQMAEAAYAKQQEKVDGPLVKTTNIINQEPVHVIYGGRETSKKDPSIEAYHTKILESLRKLDEISPRSNAILGRTQPTGERKTFGGLNLNPHSITNPIRPVQIEKQGGDTLDLGIGPVIEPVRLTSLDPPPGLLYQPSTYITANAVPNLNNSVDEAYNFYASRNPLDPYLSGGVGRGGELGGDIPIPSLDLTRVGRDGAPTSKVRFKDGRPQEAAAVGMTFSTDDDRKRNQRQQQSSYKEELERQMLEKNIKKTREKEAQERFDMKMEEEAKIYDPFGKGGGGAPMRDQYGNVITDLRQMRHDNNNRNTKFTPRGYDGDNVVQAGNTTRGAASYRDDLIGPPPAQTTAEGETSFARGGHGIFGMPKTDAEKMQADRYKIELKRQMEEKKAEEYRKKQLEKLEEERHQKILEEQRAKMQREYEEEQRRIREKEEEARRRNEEMIRAVEDKKREMERKKREAEERRLYELKEDREREVRERQRADEVQNRGKSPLIPTMRGKQNDQPDSNKVAESPPVPAARTKTYVEPRPFIQDYLPRTHSADVLNQLAHMRAQLQNERKRVQTMLNDQEDDVEIYDPRTAHRPPSVLVHVKPDYDVFETAMNRNAVAVRRTPADKANAQAAEDFNALKHKNDSDSREQFRKMFPEEPVTAEALETQQAALLREQEERLFKIRDKRAYDNTPPIHQTRNTHSSSSQLHSKSAFVDVNGIGPFPDDFEDIPRRNDSARSRRRTRVPSSPRVTSPESRSAFGSQSSLNVDKLARKNEDRLKKLRDMQGDDLSLYDPEDVLERFMSKQGHNRPPSANTLLDDTWMKTGNKNPR